MIKNIFESEKIEYFAVLSVSDAEIINPRLMPEGMKKAIVFLIPYRTDAKKTKGLAHFAMIKDYHGFSASLFERIIPRLKDIYPDKRFFGFADHSPIDERKAAYKGGLGDIGKNGLIINEKYGSFVFIGEILTDADVPELIHPKKIICDSCNLCITRCPKTEECISEISQKKRKTEKDFEILKKTGTVWGCDICGEVCPKNKNTALSPFPYFYDGIIENTEDILNMSDDEFKLYPFSYRKRNVIAENIENIYKKSID